MSEVTSAILKRYNGTEEYQTTKISSYNFIEKKKQHLLYIDVYGYTPVKLNSDTEEFCNGFGLSVAFKLNEQIAELSLGNKFSLIQSYDQELGENLSVIQFNENLELNNVSLEVIDSNDKITKIALTADFEDYGTYKPNTPKSFLTLECNMRKRKNLEKDFT